MEQEKQKIQIPMLQRSVTTELSEEFSIPDYQPEIKRILRVEARAMPADRYVGPSSAEFSGKMQYTLFYVGEDGELYGCSFEGDYRVLQPVEIPGDVTGDGILCDADIFSETVSGRLLSPRKFLIKTRLHSEIRLYATRTLEEEFPEDCASESLTETILCGTHLMGSSEGFHLFDEIPTSSDPVRVVACEGNVHVSDLSCGDGKLGCRGDLVLKLTTVQEGSGDAPTILFRSLPFDATLDLDGLESGGLASAGGSMVACDVTVEEGKILCDAEVILSARALQKSPLTYTRDRYAVGKESSITTETCVCPVLLSSGVGNFTLSSTISLAEAGLSKDETIYDVTLTPVIREVSTEGGRLILSGKCRCHAVLKNGEEWLPSEFEVPFKYDGGACREAEPSDLLASAVALSSRAKIEADQLKIDGEIALSYTLSGEEMIERVASMTVGEPIAEPVASLHICYPTASDSLWTLAKRYHKPLATLAEANNLPTNDPTTPVAARFLMV